MKEENEFYGTLIMSITLSYVYNQLIGQSSYQVCINLSFIWSCIVLHRTIEGCLFLELTFKQIESL